MTRPDVMVMSKVWPSVLDDLSRKCALHRFDTARDPEALLKSVGPSCRGVLINGHTDFGEAELAHLPNIEIVACTSAGFESFDTEAIARRGIPLTNASEALKYEVADTALMLILSTWKKLVDADSYVRTGAWGRYGAFPLLRTLTGKRAGIFGLGAIGGEIAKRLEAFRIEVGYCTRSVKDVPYRYFADVRALAEWSDILIVVVPGGDDTQGLINEEIMTALGPQGSLINIARGSVIDEPAMIRCLTTGALGSAGLDVFVNEPNPTPDLTNLPNVTLYPHHASGTQETRRTMAQMAADNLIAQFEGGPLHSEVVLPSGREKTSA